MDIAVVFSRALTGINSPQVTVEVHLSRGLPGLSIVGLPETAVKESKDRVRSAILSNRFEFPLSRIIVNLAPADLPKEGGRFDLAIAIGILVASGQLPRARLDEYEFVGELALTGALRPVRGILPVANAVLASNRQLILPLPNADEAALINGLNVLPAQHLLEVCAHLTDSEKLYHHVRQKNYPEKPGHAPDLSDIKAQHLAKRALEIAAAGSHNLLMIGPPGTGKTMLARETTPGILPPMTNEQALETAAIASISRQGFCADTWKQRPIRAPHHTASAVALVGGGSHPRPGEISLAHNGVLFLDELPEFGRHVLEVLREPLESGSISISRAANQADFPADFQLIAAMNPCPCGYLGDAGRCQCNAEMIRRYRGKISGPLLDRIDMHIEVPNISREILRNSQFENSDSSRTVSLRVTGAYQRQIRRCRKPNSKLNPNELTEFCKLDEKQFELLEQAIEKLGLSARAMHRILRVTRTIADLAGSDEIAMEHLAEAITYRRLEKIEAVMQ